MHAMHSLVLLLHFYFIIVIFFWMIFSFRASVQWFSRFQPFECVFFCICFNVLLFDVGCRLRLWNEMKINKLIACFALINLNGSSHCEFTLFAHCSAKRLRRRIKWKLPFVYFVCDTSSFFFMPSHLFIEIFF